MILVELNWIVGDICKCHAGSVGLLGKFGTDGPYCVAFHNCRNPSSLQRSDKSVA